MAKKKGKSKHNIKKTKIRVVGIGGGGSSIVSEIAPRIRKRSVNFAVANTDLQALEKAPKQCRVVQFGEELTRGLGTGMNPKLGRAAAEESEKEIKDLFHNQDLSILVSCLGGGVGSGASPFFAKVSKKKRNTNLGIFTMPFEFEGKKKIQIAKKALKKVEPHLNAFAIIPNQRIFQIVENPAPKEVKEINKKTPLNEALSAINTILADFLEGLIEIIYLPGTINIDWADLETALKGRRKLAYLNSVQRKGEDRAKKAIKTLLNSSIYSYPIEGAERILFNIVGGKDLRIHQVERISKAIAKANTRAKIIFGISQRNQFKDKIKITLLGVGCEEREKPKKKKKKKKSKKSSSKKSKKKKKKKTKKKKKKKPKKKPKKKKEKKKEKPRRNALDLKKEAEKIEQELLEEEKKWDTPAFLRRKES